MNIKILIHNSEYRYLTELLSMKYAYEKHNY